MKMIVALAGSIVYAGAGAAMGSMNAGWFDLKPNTNGLLPFLGIGVGLVALAFTRSELGRRLWRAGALGRSTAVLFVVSPIFFISSWLIDFAIFGTLSCGVGLICLSVSVWRGRLVPPIDRVLVSISAVASLTWNTETLSAFLLVGVGLIWALLSIRMLSTGSKRPAAAI